jgi:transcriptional regulator with XRE-family HTH domain
MDDLESYHVVTYADISRRNARVLADSVGGFARFAEKVGVSESQVSQLLGKNPIRNIGVKTARRIEEAFDKPLGWIDQPHEENAAAVELSSDSSAETELRILRDQVGKAAACLRAFETANATDKTHLVTLALKLLEED